MPRIPRVEVGDCAIVCEDAVLRATAVGDEDHPVIVGDHAFVSPQATLLGCEVERRPTWRRVRPCSREPASRLGAVVAVGGLVHGGTVLPSGFFLAPGLIAIGDRVATYAPGDPSLAEAIRGGLRGARLRRLDCVGGPGRPLPRDRRGALEGVRRSRWRRSGGALDGFLGHASVLSNKLGSPRTLVTRPGPQPGRSRIRHQ
jgi:hypothetical protein